jgi:hypothetical protein
MKPPLQAFERVFSLNNRRVLTRRITSAVANLVLTTLLTVTAFAKGSVTIATTSLPNALVGTFYSGTVNAMDGCTPYRWSIVSGSLPPGLSGEASSSTTSFTISGTPTETGSGSFEVQVEGCGGHISQETFTIQVQQLSSAVDLNWSASTSPNITGYNVYRSTVSGGPYSKITTGGLVGGTNYTDTTVTTGSVYYYVTTAVNSSNLESSYSSQITVDVP